jgi:sirohydrochlorin cobaltochelatase
MNGDFDDADLVLVGHGSTLNAESAAPTLEHAESIRRRGLFSQVLEGFWKEHPTFAGALRGAFAPRVFVVPLFISDGYFTEQVIPREMGFCRNGQTNFPRVQVRGDQTFYYAEPVGTHASMTSVILARAADVVTRHPGVEGSPPLADTSLFIAGHGTGNNENSRKAIERQVDLIRARGLYRDVHPIFMEEEPRIADCYTLAAAPNVVIVPFFISDGLHSYEDIPMMLGESESDVRARLAMGKPTWVNPTERHGRRVWYSSSIGREPLVVDVILERAREMAVAHPGHSG